MIAYIAAGTNLGRREASVLAGLRSLEEGGAARIRAVSSLYESDPDGIPGAPRLVEQGMVGYLKDVESAKGNPRVTDRPLLVKALKTDGPNKTDLVISNSDAQVLHGMQEHLTFLEKARVMVILD